MTAEERKLITSEIKDERIQVGSAADLIQRMLDRKQKVPTKQTTVGLLQGYLWVRDEKGRRFNLKESQILENGRLRPMTADERKLIASEIKDERIQVGDAGDFLQRMLDRKQNVPTKQTTVGLLQGDLWVRDEKGRRFNLKEGQVLENGKLRRMTAQERKLITSEIKDERIQVGSAADLLQRMIDRKQKVPTQQTTVGLLEGDLWVRDEKGRRFNLKEGQVLENGRVRPMTTEERKLITSEIKAERIRVSKIVVPRGIKGSKSGDQISNLIGRQQKVPTKSYVIEVFEGKLRFVDKKTGKTTVIAEGQRFADGKIGKILNRSMKRFNKQFDRTPPE
ncbi:hypothetical protein ACFL35_18520, partial [Candidatus Riflebacteria bacterium]